MNYRLYTTPSSHIHTLSHGANTDPGSVANKKAGGRLTRCLAFAIWGRLLGWQRRLGLRLEERPRAALRIDIVAKEPHRKLVVVGQVVDLALLAAVTNDQVVGGRKASCAASILALK